MYHRNAKLLIESAHNCKTERRSCDHCPGNKDCPARNLDLWDIIAVEKYVEEHRKTKVKIYCEACEGTGTTGPSDNLFDCKNCAGDGWTWSE